MGDNRHGHRDALMVLLAYRHGLRAAEVVDLRWEQIDFKTAVLHVRRVKNGTPSTHPFVHGCCRHQKAMSGFLSENRPTQTNSYLWCQIRNVLFNCIM